MWQEINNKSEIEQLLHQFGGFHDSCLIDIYISTSEFVDQNRAMHSDNTLSASLIFQRQSKNNPVLELKFEQAVQLNFQPLSEMGLEVIYDCTLINLDGLFYWADFAGWEIGDNDAIWVCGRKLFWRMRPELLGNINRIILN